MVGRDVRRHVGRVAAARPDSPAPQQRFAHAAEAVSLRELTFKHAAAAAQREAGERRMRPAADRRSARRAEGGPALRPCRHLS